MTLLAETDPRPHGTPAYIKPTCPRCQRNLTMLPHEEATPRYDKWHCVHCDSRSLVRAIYLDLPLVEEHKRDYVRKMLSRETRYENGWTKRAEHFTMVRERNRSLRDAMNDNSTPTEEM